MNKIPKSKGIIYFKTKKEGRIWRAGSEAKKYCKYLVVT